MATLSNFFKEAFKHFSFPITFSVGGRFKKHIFLANLTPTKVTQGRFFRTEFTFTEVRICSDVTGEKLSKPSLGSVFNPGQIYGIPTFLSHHIFETQNP